MTLRDDAVHKLRNACTDLGDGYDIPPARRSEIETLFRLAMQRENYSTQQLQADCAPILPPHCAVIVETEFDNKSGDHQDEQNRDGVSAQHGNYPRVILQVWQQRAPVVPSTKI